MMWHLRATSLPAALIAASVLMGCDRDSQSDLSPPPSSPDAQVASEHSDEIVKVSNAWIRSNPVPGRPSAAFFELENTGNEDLRLSGASLPDGGRAELHTHKHEDGIMRMARIDGLTIPAGGSVALERGGHHLMLFDVPVLKVGERLKLVLHFDGADDRELLADVQPLTAAGPGQGVDQP